MSCFLPKRKSRSHQKGPTQCKCGGARKWLNCQWKRVTSMLHRSRRRMTKGDTQVTEGDTSGGLYPCDTLGQLPPNNKEAEPPLETNAGLPGPQDNMGVTEAQRRRQPPPKPPRRNKGRVVWYSGSCPYSDWPPTLKEKAQKGPGPQEPKKELQPMTTRNTLVTEGDSPGGLCPCDTSGQLPHNNKEAEPLLEAKVALPGPQDNMGAAKAQGRRQPPPPKPPRRNKGRVIWYSGSCPYSDWPPSLKERPQRGPGLQEPEEKLQPVPEMTTEVMQDT
ncbi:uncharacterized protein LOC132532691 [Erinaceus europaeus]|uniref:Uncharacterized protein LOC132532691 n=1 Tax=Erinaceus europaeus TaxID=9365 RepID=A0ABM3VRM8_ERIEU|nr:uncharacterized protein LOC132532691 [Erinaceus europaeus]